LGQSADPIVYRLTRSGPDGSSGGNSFCDDASLSGNVIHGETPRRQIQRLLALGCSISRFEPDQGADRLKVLRLAVTVSVSHGLPNRSLIHCPASALMFSGCPRFGLRGSAFSESEDRLRRQRAGVVAIVGIRDCKFLNCSPQKYPDWNLVCCGS